VNEDEFAGIVGMAMRERFPLPDKVDLLPRLTAPAPRSFRLRPMLAVAAAVLTVAVVSIVLALRPTANHRAAGSADDLIGLDWQGDPPVIAMTFTDHTVRIFDGCTNELHQVTIGGGWLHIGDPIGESGACSGLAYIPGAPPSPVDKFDQVVYSHGDLTWQRSGDTLVLTNARGDTVELHTNGPALDVTGQTWGLSRYNDAREYSHSGSVAATLRIDQSGTVYASDLCHDLSGSATVTDTTITFSDMHGGNGACSDQASAAAAEVVDHVLSGTIDYTIRGDELILNGKDNGLLIYLPTS
jgi:heat shock protein HslJ